MLTLYEGILNRVNLYFPDLTLVSYNYINVRVFSQIGYPFDLYDFFQFLDNFVHLRERYWKDWTDVSNFHLIYTYMYTFNYRYEYLKFWRFIGGYLEGSCGFFNSDINNVQSFSQIGCSYYLHKIHNFFPIFEKFESVHSFISSQNSIVVWWEMQNLNQFGWYFREHHVSTSRRDIRAENTMSTQCVLIRTYLYKKEAWKRNFDYRFFGATISHQVW